MKKFIIGLAAVSFAVVTSFAFTAKKNATIYFFQVSNTVTPGNETSATLSFPSSTPPTSLSGASWSCDETDVHDCDLAFPGYKKDINNVYEPSTSPNGGTIIPQSSYNTYSQLDTKD